jgi:hypothetical protein
VEYAEATPEALRALNLLSVAALLQENGDEPIRGVSGVELAYRGRDARVYSNDDALPRAFLVDRQRVVGSEDEALDAVLEPGFDGARVAITESPVEGVLQADSSGAPDYASAGDARVVSYEHERAVVDAAANRPSLLVLTDVHFPGWKVTVDGEERSLERVDYLLRGVMLPPGRHRVEFAYEPASWTAARAVTLAGLLALAAALAAGLAPFARRGRERIRRP